MDMNIDIAATPEDVVQRCARHVIDQLQAALDARGVARIALAGGTTPRRLYAELAQNHSNDIDWSSVEFYFGDERNVPLDHPDSNFRMASESLFTPLGIAPRRLFPIVSPQQRDPEYDAENYERQLRTWSSGPVPTLDIALLGMGEDGHFASLFPDTLALNERERLVVVNPIPKLHAHRLTMTFPMFEAARSVCFLVTGANKHDAFASLRGNDMDTPTRRLIQSRATDWFVDQACAEGSGP